MNELISVTGSAFLSRIDTGCLIRYYGLGRMRIVQRVHLTVDEPHFGEIIKFV